MMSYDFALDMLALQEEINKTCDEIAAAHAKAEPFGFDAYNGVKKQ
jgi:hypothetical protein